MSYHGTSFIFRTDMDILSKEQQRDWNKIKKAARQLAIALGTLLEHVRNHYLEIDLDEMSANAWRRYVNFHKEMERMFESKYGSFKEARQPPGHSMSLQLCNLLSLAGIDLGGFKIHLATGWPNPPLIAYFDGEFKEWQEYQNRRNFQCDNVIPPIHLHSDKWLFVGVWKLVVLLNPLLKNPDFTLA